MNIKVEDGYFGYYTNNYPLNSGCNIARKSDIRWLQNQIDELEEQLEELETKPKKVNKKK